jgi:hypothetical protein
LSPPWNVLVALVINLVFDNFNKSPSKLFIFPSCNCFNTADNSWAIILSSKTPSLVNFSISFKKEGVLNSFPAPYTSPATFLKESTILVFPPIHPYWIGKPTLVTAFLIWPSGLNIVLPNWTEVLNCSNAL